MKFLGCAVAALCAAALGAQDSRPVYASPSGEKLDLRVLYTGRADDPRTVDFVAFLSATFAKVGTVESAKLDASAAKDFDVVIVDAPSPYGEGDKFNFPKVPELKDWTRPTVLMGAAGGALLGPQKLKLDWL